MNKTITNVLPKRVKIHITYKGQNLSSRFQIKIKINEKHKHDLIYHTKCSEPFSTEDYLAEIGRMIIEQVADRGGMTSSHIYISML